MNKSELTFSAILVPLDYLVVFLAGLVAHGLRFGTFLTDIRPVIYELSFRNFLPILLIASSIWIFVFALSGLYNIKTTRRMVEELAKIFLACSTAVLIIIVFIFFQRELFSSRFIIISGWLLSIIFISIERFIIRSIQRHFLKKGIGIHRVFVVGKDATTGRIVNELNDNPGLGYKIVGQLKEVNESEIQKLKESLKDSNIDEVIQADPNIQKELVLKIIDICNEYHITFKYVANLFETSVTNIAIAPLAGIPVIEMKKTPLDGWGKIFKRAFDIIFSVFILIILIPFIIIIAVIIKLDSAGPVFVKLERVGQKGRKFLFFKFRSMIEGAHAMKKDLIAYNERSDGPLFKMKNDPRITRFGKFLRKTSIDEIPQFFNVIKGDMSVVGPRPHEPEEVSRYQKDHKKLLTIKPGMTGMAQVSGRSDLNFEEEATLDVYYIENWSLLLDLQLIFRTPFALVSRRGAP